MTTDLERVTRMAEECGMTDANMSRSSFKKGSLYLTSKEELLAYTQNVEQAVLAKRDERINKLDALIHRIFETTVPYNEKGECVFCESVLNEWKELYEL